MGKKSAASKGYRKYAAPKKEMTAKELRNVKIIVIAFVVILVVIFASLAIVDHIGIMRVKDGVVVGAVEGDVLRNTQSQSKPRVYRMAHITEAVPGYTAVETDRAINTFWSNDFVADDENSDLPSYSIMVGNGDYETLSSTAVDSMNQYATVIDRGEVTSAEFGGKNCRYFNIFFSVDNSEAQDGSDISYNQNLYAYFPGKFDGYCIMVQVAANVQDENDSVPVESMTELLEQIAQRLEILDKFGK